MCERVLASATANRGDTLTLLAEPRISSGRSEAAIEHLRERSRLAPNDAANLRRLGAALLSRPAFFGVLKQADVYLDTVGFSGFNTLMHSWNPNCPA